MASMAFQDFMLWLREIGVADVLVPFLLVFVIVFAILQKIEMFGPRKDTKKFHVIIALVLGLAVVFPHILYPGSRLDVVQYINIALPNIGIIIIAIIMFLLIIGAFGAKYEIANTNIGAVISVIAAIIVIYVFGAAAGWGWRIPRALSFLEDPNTYMILIIILVFGILIAYITHEPKTGSGKGEGSEVWKFFREPLK